MQVTYPPPSLEHLKVDPCSLEVKVKVAVLELDRDGGPLVMVATGRTVSTVQSSV